MKSSFNFLQIANWVYICINNLKKIKLDDPNATKEEIKNNIRLQKKKIHTLIDILEKNSNIHGISPLFIKNLMSIKKEYGVEE